MRAAQATLALDFEADPSWWIYVLCDPRVTDPILRIRYVGVTSKGIEVRLKGHIQNAHGGKTHRVHWIRELQALGLEPTIEIVDCGAGKRPWDRNERSWIAHYRSKGCPLTNACDGGRGVLNPTVETRERQSAAAKAAWESPDVRAKQKATRASPEVRAKMSAAAKAACSSPEYKARQSAALKAACASPEARERHSAAAKAAWARKRAAKLTADGPTWTGQAMLGALEQLADGEVV